MHVGETMLAHLLRCEPCRFRAKAVLANEEVLADHPDRWATVRRIVRMFPTRDQEGA